MNPWVTGMAVFANGVAGRISGNFIDTFRKCDEQPSRKESFPQGPRQRDCDRAEVWENIHQMSVYHSRHNAEERVK